MKTTKSKNELAALAPAPATEPRTVKDLLDWAESIICNAGSLTHCTQAEADDIVKKWRDEKHAMFPDGIAPAPTLAESAESAAEDICDIEGICIGACPGDSDLTAKSVKPDKVAAIIRRHFSHLSVPQQAAVSQAPREAIERAVYEALGDTPFHVTRWEREAQTKAVLTALTPHLSPAPDANDTAMLENCRAYLAVILPMARGYAAEHNVGNNQRMVDEAADALCAAMLAEGEKKS